METQKAAGDGQENQRTQVSARWRSFVDEVARQGRVSLVSSLKNAVVLAMDDSQLVIGTQNIQVFTEEKRRQIEETARAFFHEDIQIIYRESGQGLDDSLQAQNDLARKQAVETKKKAASRDPRVVKLLNLFPDAEIADITILDEEIRDV